MEQIRISKFHQNKHEPSITLFITCPLWISLQYGSAQVLTMTIIKCAKLIRVCSLKWRHNEHDGVSNHQHHQCLLNRLFRRRLKKTSKLRVTGLHRSPVNSPHKWSVKRKMFPFDDVIMLHIHLGRVIFDQTWDLPQMKRLYPEDCF